MKLTRKALGYRITELESALEHANSRSHSNADFWKQRYEEQLGKIEALAIDHSKFSLHGRHPVDTSVSAAFFCDRCHATWPCEPFRVATGKDFAPIKLQLREETP